MSPRIPTITESGGLKPHIDNGRDQQRNLGYDDFMDMKKTMGPYALAKAFRRNVKTIYVWLKVAEKEGSNVSE